MVRSSFVTGLELFKRYRSSSNCRKSSVLLPIIFFISVACLVLKHSPSSCSTSLLACVSSRYSSNGMNSWLGSSEMG